MRDPYLVTLVLLNILLTLSIAFYLYRTKRFRTAKLTTYSIIFLILWAFRYSWMLYVFLVETYIDFVNRIVSLALSGVIIMAFLVIKTIFPADTNQHLGKLIEKLSRATMVLFSVVLIPLSIILPTDPVRNDINIIIALIIAMGAAFLLFFIFIRFLHRFNYFAKEFFKWYNIGLFLGIFLVISGDTIFYWIFHIAELQLLAPLIGLIIILGSFIATRIIPFFQFAKMIDTGILIVDIKDRKIEYANLTAQEYVPPNQNEKLAKLTIDELWKQKPRILEGFSNASKESRTTLVEEQLFNFKQEREQNIQVTFYPLAIEQVPTRIGILIMNSDEIEFLKQRKDFLLDILTHDLANVSQTLLLSLEALSNKISSDSPDWELIHLALSQNKRLEQLIFSTQNLLYIDKISSAPKELYPDFNKRFQDLIKEKMTQYPKIVFEMYNLDQLKSIGTTGNLKAAFSLLIDSIAESLKDKRKLIKVEMKLLSNIYSQEIIFDFTGNEISSSLFDNYLEENKSALVASSSYRINLIVATAIIQKNRGNISIIRNDHQELNTRIIVTLPYIEQ